MGDKEQSETKARERKQEETTRKVMTRKKQENVEAGGKEAR